MFEPGADRDLLVSAARAAGELIMAFKARGVREWEKNPGDPVCEADLAADALLKERLQPARPDYGWLSEETADDQSRLNTRRSFMIDPLDGTRAFLKGRPEFVVACAVVEHGHPIAAAIYDPSADAMYDAVKGGGARKDGVTLSISRHDRILGARLIGDPGRLADLRALGAEAQTVNSAALRLCHLAEGRADAVVAVRPKWDWDLAAGHLLVEEAGGVFTTSKGERVLYNRDSAVQAPPLAAGPTLHALLLERLAKAS